VSSVAATDPTFTSDALNAGPYRLQWNPAYGIVVSREAESRAPTALPRLTPIYLRRTRSFPWPGGKRNCMKC
jgi:hypothetical protein